MSLEEEKARFYICPTCFEVSESPQMCHGRQMVMCEADSVEDCRPPRDASGQVKTRAPRWFLRAKALLRKDGA